MFKKGFTIELDDIPETNEEICIALARYCGENGRSYEFIKRTHPIVATIDGTKYEVTKKFVKRYRINLWVLQCKEIN